MIFIVRQGRNLKLFNDQVSPSKLIQYKTAATGKKTGVSCTTLLVEIFDAARDKVV